VHDGVETVDGNLHRLEVQAGETVQVPGQKLQVAVDADLVDLGSYLEHVENTSLPDTNVLRMRGTPPLRSTRRKSAAFPSASEPLSPEIPTAAAGWRLTMFTAS
jgi:hypothetical protein